MFDRIRALNVEALKVAASRHAPCHVEPALRDDDGNIAVEGPFDLPCRVDLIPIDEDEELLEPVMVDPPTSLSFDQVHALCGNVPLLISPFGWDYAHIRASFPVAPDIGPVTKWFWNWFDPEDEGDEDLDGLFSVVHYLSDPEFSEGKLAMTVDFGSAPVESLEALLSVLVEMGAERIWIG